MLWRVSTCAVVICAFPKQLGHRLSNLILVRNRPETRTLANILDWASWIRGFHLQFFQFYVCQTSANRQIPFIMSQKLVDPKINANRAKSMARHRNPHASNPKAKLWKWERGKRVRLLLNDIITACFLCPHGKYQTSIFILSLWYVEYNV